MKMRSRAIELLVVAAVTGGCGDAASSRASAPLRCEDVFTPRTGGTDWTVCRGGASTDADDAVALQAALAAACRGDRIRLTGRRYVGSFAVPPGVALEGGGATFEGPVGRAALCVGTGGGLPTRVSDVRIHADGVGVVAGRTAGLDGPAIASFERVDIVVAHGYGLVADGLDRLDVRALRLEGALDDDAAAAIRGPIDPGRSAVAGLLAAGGDVRLEAVEATGFAGFGVVLHDATTSWSGGAISGVLGTSLLVEAGRADLANLRITEGRRAADLERAPLTNGLVVTDGASVTTQDVLVRDIPGVGVLQDAATSVHRDLVVADNDDAGIWVQNSAEFALRVEGGASRVEGNRGAGILFRDSSGLDLESVFIGGTRGKPQADGPFGVTEIGDGAHIVGAAGDLRLATVTLRSNARSGLLVDGTDAEAMASYAFEAVVVDGDGDHGVVVQNGVDVPREGLAVATALAERDAQLAASGQTLAVFTPLERIAGTGLAAGLIGVGGLVTADGSIAAEVVVNADGRVEDVAGERPD